MTLSEHDLALLEFSRRRWTSAGRRDAALLATFGMPAPAYAAELARILAHPDAEAYDAALVRRLRRLKEARRRDRPSRAQGFDLRA